MLPDFFLVALAKVELKPEQTTAVQAIQDDLQKAREASRTAHEKLVSDLADGVSTGKIDQSTIDADIGALRSAITAMAPALQDTMNRLHATLGPEQRKQVVAVLREKAKEAKQREGTGMGPAFPAERLKVLEEDLAMSPEQRKTLEEKLERQFKANANALREKLSVLGTQINLLADAFAGEKFDAKLAGVGAYGPDVIATLAKHRLEFVKTVMAVLKPEQDALFAKKIRARVGSADSDADTLI